MFHKQTRPRLRPFSGPTAALLWEQWRLFLLLLAGAVFTAAAGTLGLYINMLQHKIAEADALLLSDNMRRLCAIILPVLFCANVAGGVSFPQRLYRLPVATRRMVLYVAVPRLVFLPLTLFILLGFRMLMFGAPDWDAELRMTVLSIEALIACLALSWSLGAFRSWPAVFGQTLVIGLSVSLYDILGKPGVRYFLGPDILWPLAGCWAAGWILVLLAGPFRARSGIGLLWRLRRLRPTAPAQVASGGPIRLRRFSSPFEAQAWYERRTRGYAGLLYPLLFFVSIVLLGFQFFDFGASAAVFSTALNIAVLALGACFAVAASRRLVEAYRVRTGRFRFLAAKPISTQDLARVRFNTMWKGMESALLFAAAITILLWLVPPKPVLLTPSVWPLWLADAYRCLNGRALTWVVVWAAALWTCASMTALSTPNVLLMFAVWPLLQLAATYAPVRVLMDSGGNEVVVALTGLCLGAHVVRMFMRARRKALLSPVTMMLSLAVYSVLTCLVLTDIVFPMLWSENTLESFGHLVWTTVVLGALGLVVAPVAALPLQFDRWRHGGK